MKIKLNMKQIENIRRQLEKTDRKRFDTSDVSEIFRMLQYWSKTVGGSETKISSITEMVDGYICRVNGKFRESMKAFLKQDRSSQPDKERGERTDEERTGILGNTDRYQRLIRQAEQKQNRRNDV